MPFEISSLSGRLAEWVEDLHFAAVTVYREARGEPYEGQVAVARAIVERAVDSKNRWPRSLKAVCLQPRQFDCWSPKDANYNVYPGPLDYQKFVRIVLDAFTSNPADGANHYLNPAIADPAVVRQFEMTMTKTASIGQHSFYRAA